jgi:hypothetical protein
MNTASECDKNFYRNTELNQHMPKAFQTMLKIERMAQDRLQQIKNSVERGETTLQAIKRERGSL